MLTRTEEILLLAVHDLGKDAYGVNVLRRAEEWTGRSFSTGAVYVPLDRMVKRGLLDSWEADPTPERGGRRKRYFRLTAGGVQALLEVRRLERRLWEIAPNLESA